MQLLFASSNPHKIEEVAAILSPLGIEVHGLDSLPQQPPEPDETGETFEANARIKAIEYAKATGQLCLADDSGLEVDALGCAPGVHSARYAGSDVRKTRIPRAEQDAANNAKLLRELADVPFEQRTARFVCVMCLADAQGNILAETRGTFPGLITNQLRGTNGFGYDPLLYLPDRQCTCAELTPAEKNARSHRGEASRKMAQIIVKLMQPRMNTDEHG
jgi:XTP/dITP diphosphohydrolase